MSLTKGLIVTALVQFLLVIRRCAATDSITTDQAIRDGEVLVSDGEMFELGFFSPGKSTNRYVGIWYKKDKGKTVVWVANRDNPVNDTSGVLSIGAHGNLILYAGNQTNSLLWSTKSNVSVLSVTGDPTTTYKAQVLDTGNLVLVQQEGKSEKVTWQSFDYPTHTLIPSMKLGLNKRTGFKWFLTSWKSEDDPGTGNYTYAIDPNGVPQLILYSGNLRWWRTGNWNGITWWWGNEPVILTTSFVLNASYMNNENEITVTWGVLNTSISKCVIDSSGLIQQLNWYEQDLGWNRIWYGPMDRCDYYGRCGAFGYCNSDSLTAFECKCLPGFKPKSAEEWSMRDASSGCVRKLEACQNGEGFVKLAKVKIPDTSLARMDMNLDWKACEKQCFRNCSCSAYAINSNGNMIGCITWYGDLVDTRDFADGGQDLYIRVDALELAEYTNKSKGFLAKKGMLPVLVVSGAMIFFFICLGCWCAKRKRNDYPRETKENEDSRRTHPDVTFFDLKNIVGATNNFSAANKLGEGGFGTVYKGVLANGQEVAVKRLSNDSGQGLEEFKNEVTLIAKLQHRNLVRLFGCCIHAEEKMLIYECLANKSLDFFIFDKSRSSLLDWKKRFEIILGIARGVLYLHQDSRLKIIHRDLKASNVLLDSTMNPKISDFGLAKMFGEDQIQAKTNRVVGTFGYMSPEYAMEGRYSTKSDVFSFGVLLLEIISGKRNTTLDIESSSPNLIGQIWDLWTEEQSLSIVDPSMDQSYPADEVSRCIQISLLCVQESSSDRPAMSEVVFMLGNETTLPSPKKPAFILKSSKPNSAESKGGTPSLNDVTITMLQAR